jgi:hypothetical protein
MPSIWLLTSCSEFFLHGSEPVAEDPVLVSETFVQEALPLVDILWVVDNTASMEDELRALGATANAFVQSLNELELAWQLGIVTMDTTPESDPGVLRGEPWIVTPQTPKAASVFEATLGLATSETAHEAGLAAAILALTPPRIDDDNRGFRRAGAALEIVFVSDGDDDGDSDDVLGGGAFEAFLQLMGEEADRSGEPAVASAIVGDVPSGCTPEEGKQALPGTAFVAAAEATGGIVRSVCSPDLEPILQQIGATGAVWPTTFALQATPDPDTIRVDVDGTRLDQGWALELSPPAIVFDEAPVADARIVVQYEVVP